MLFSENLNRLWTYRGQFPNHPPFSPRMFWVQVALMMISVLKRVTLTSTPKYLSSTNSVVNTSLSSAMKTPSATNFRFLLIWARTVNFVFLFFSTQLSLSQIYLQPKNSSPIFKHFISSYLPRDRHIKQPLLRTRNKPRNTFSSRLITRIPQWFRWWVEYNNFL